MNNKPLKDPLYLCNNYQTINDVLAYHKKNKPNEIAYYFILNDNKHETITYQELFDRAHALALVIQQQTTYLDRVLLAAKPGLDFIIGFYACLMARTIAVPIFPPVNSRTTTRLVQAISNAQPQLALFDKLTSSSLFFAKKTDAFLPKTLKKIMGFDETQTALFAELKKIRSLVISDYQDLKSSQKQLPQCLNTDIAFLQYTSGSISKPKGVMITHENLLHNMDLIRNALGVDGNSRFFCWLPPYHDMGLIGGILTPIYAGIPAILMSTLDFIECPSRWVQGISKFQCTISAAANFAFALCAEKTPAELIKTIDLSCVEALANGGEPINPSSMDAFYEKFKPAGLRPNVCRSSFGLAESTLFVSVKNSIVADKIIHVDMEQLKNHKIQITEQKFDTKTLISCGKPVLNVKIVNPDTLEECQPFEVGEIWINGSSVSQGYFNQPGESEKTFQANIKNDLQKINYLRSGDLGFLYQGELFVTGRLKSMIIMYGQNYYPHDIEHVVEKAHPAVRKGCVVAYAMQVGEGEELAVISEIRQGTSAKSYPAIADSLKKVIREQLHIEAYFIALVPQRTIPKTTSGKLQRYLCKELIENHRLIPLWSYTAPFKDPVKQQVVHELNPEEVKKWLSNWFLTHLDIVMTKSHYQKKLTDLGISSLTASTLANELKIQFALKIDILPLFEHHPLDSCITLLATKGKPYEALTEKKSLSKATKLKKIERIPLVEPLSNYVDKSLISQLKTLYFNVTEGVSNHQATIDGKQYINYSGYNYLGLSGHPQVIEATIENIRKFGSSVSASRLASGEKPLHIAMEKAIANLIGTEDCVVFSSGYSTNISVITHLFGKSDLILYDELSHNSILSGIRYSGAEAISFPHNRYSYLSDFLEKYRDQYKKVLIVSEGIFSMDGDIPDVHELIRIKKQFDTFLMIDEAHSIGSLGKTGRGIREYFNLNPSDIDIWMGTLSKSFASCGGYIAGSNELIENLKYTAAGFIYSAGISPANTAAALAAIEVMNKEPERLDLLRQRHSLLLSLLKKQSISTGLSQNTPIIPLIVKQDSAAIKLSNYLKKHSILALPIVYPAVEKNAARVRLFVNCLHTEEQINETAEVIKASEAYCI